MILPKIGMVCGPHETSLDIRVTKFTVFKWNDYCVIRKVKDV